MGHDGDLGPFPENDDALQRALCVARLYVILMDRPVDPDGLGAFTRQLEQGRPLEEIVKDLLKSDEFRNKLGDFDATEAILRNYRKASGREAAPSGDLVETIMTIVGGDRGYDLPVLHTLFEDGLPLENGYLYRAWLMERKALTPISEDKDRQAAEISMSVVIVLDNLSGRFLEDCISSVCSAPGRTNVSDIVLCSPRRLLPEERFKAASLLGRSNLSYTIQEPGILPGRKFDIARTIRSCNGAFTCVISCTERLTGLESQALRTALLSKDVIFSDGDLHSEDGRRHSPRFHNCWDLDAFISGPPQGAVLVRTSMLKGLHARLDDVVGLRWAVLLNVALKVPIHRIGHLPSIMLSRSDRHEQVGVRHPVPTFNIRRHPEFKSLRYYNMQKNRILYPLPSNPPLVSILIPTRNRRSMLENCLRSIFEKTSYKNFEVVVLDNETNEFKMSEAIEQFKCFGSVRSIEVQGDFNWSRINNVGVKYAHGDIIILLNNDTEVVSPDWLEEIIRQLLRPGVGIVGTKLLYLEGDIQHAGITLGPNGRACHVWRHTDGQSQGYMGQLQQVHRVSAVTGACLAIHRSIYQRVGGCDEEDLKVAWNDVDLCLKVRSIGYDVIWTPFAVLTHIEQASRGSDFVSEATRDRLRREQTTMIERWGKLLDEDLFFSSNLCRREAADPGLCLLRTPD